MKKLISLLLIFSFAQVSFAQNRNYQAMNCDELKGALAVQENRLTKFEINQYAVNAKMQEIKVLSEKYRRNKTIAVGSVVTGTLSVLGSLAIMSGSYNGQTLKSKVIQISAAVSAVLIGEFLLYKGAKAFNANEQQALENKKEEALLQTWNTAVDTYEAISDSISITKNEIKFIKAYQTTKVCGQ